MPSPNQHDLYLLNRLRLQSPLQADVWIDAFEQGWIDGRLREITGRRWPDTLPALKIALADQIDAESSTFHEEAEYVAAHMSRDEFRILVQEFAIDGLTEAQAFYYALPRLPLEAQMPLLRIMIDEFGSGNIRRAHTTLYVDLLKELGMPTTLDHYIDRYASASFEFVNLFYWLTLRADDVSYFAGALTYLETAIPSFFECYAQACHRLGIRAHAYYTEHQHIDGFHAVEGQRLLQAMDAAGVLDPARACKGALLASHITDLAFRAAVDKARRTAAAPIHAEVAT